MTMGEEEDRYLEVELSAGEIIRMRIRIGGTDVQVPPVPPRPKPNFLFRLDLGADQFAAISLERLPR
jgi:hypothetical protein